MPQSKELTEFYQSYAAWLDSDAPVSDDFCRYLGLCSQCPGSVVSEMREQFKEAGRHSEYPFNEGSFRHYSDECHNSEAHNNAERIRWVRNRCLG